MTLKNFTKQDFEKALAEYTHAWRGYKKFYENNKEILDKFAELESEWRGREWALKEIVEEEIAKQFAKQELLVDINKIENKIEEALCQVCGEPMPEGEEMFNYHGYSGDCPKLPLKKKIEEPGKEEVFLHETLHYKIFNLIIVIYFLTAFAGVFMLIIYGVYKLLKLLAGIC